MHNDDTDVTQTDSPDVDAARLRAASSVAPWGGPMHPVIAFFARRRLLIVALLACLAWLIVWAGFWALSLFGGAG